MRLLRSTLVTTLAAALVTAAATPLAAQPFAPTNTIDGLGVPGILRIGQTFVAPVTTPFLQGFSFYLGESFNGANLRFDAAVYEYAGGAAVGAPLTVAATGVAGSSNALGLDLYSFGTGNLLLDPSRTYLLLLTATGAADANPDGARNLFGTTEDPMSGGGDVYAGGTLVLGDDLAALQELDFDAAFDAQFAASTVPEPATVVLLGGGLAIVGAFVRRRRA